MTLAARKIKKGSKLRIKDMTSSVKLKAHPKLMPMGYELGTMNSLEGKLGNTKMTISKDNSDMITMHNRLAPQLNSLNKKPSGFDFFRIPITKWIEFTNYMNTPIRADTELRVLKSISRTHFNHFFTNSLLKLDLKNKGLQKTIKQQLVLERNASNSQGFLHTVQTSIYLNSIKKRINTSSKEDILDLNEKVEVNRFQYYQVYLNSYFEHIHPYFPVISKKDLLDPKTPPSLILVTAVCYGGAVFLKGCSNTTIKYFETRTMNYVKQCYNINRLDIICAILILVYLEYDLKYYARGWIYLGIATRMGYTLGLNIKPSKYLPPDTIEKRSRIWWWIYILNKLFAFGLYRPWCIEFAHCSSPFPKDTRGDIMCDRCNPSLLFQSQLLLMFTKHMAILFHKLSFIYTLQRGLIYRIEEIDINMINYIKDMVDVQYKRWDKRMTRDFYNIYEKYGSELPLLKNYVINLRVLFLGSWIEMIRTFVKSNSTQPCLDLINKLSESTSSSIISQVEKGGKMFLRYGNQYRVYCLSNATATQLAICFSYNTKEIHLQPSFGWFKSGFLLLGQAAVANRLPKFLCRLIVSMATDKSIDIFDHLPKEAVSKIKLLLESNHGDET
ncbi:hypothetical protein K502DRAFT_322926 [Neoconidiobolus thromboides FSU 785]|nr:hypothetical protein K502DRAFT_322926 [Neoconidiobolus thromboides FSU 785]